MGKIYYYEADEIPCPSSPILVDGVYKSDLPSGDSLNVEVIDQNDASITPLSSTVSGGVATVKVNVPICLDAVTTLNTSPFLTLPSGSVTDIELINEGGSDVVPLSVVGSTITLEDKLYLIFNFEDLEDLFIVNITTLNVGTFTSQIATNIGVFSYSSDGITFATVTYPFTPLIGTGWFKRSNYAGPGILQMIGI